MLRQRTIVNRKSSRRQALQLLLSMASYAVLANKPVNGQPTSTAVPQSRSQSILEVLADSVAASPGKQQLLASLSHAEHAQLLTLLTGAERELEIHSEYRIQRSSLWGIGRLPNYTTPVPAQAPTGPAVCAACYGSSAVYHVSPTGQVRVLDTGAGTNPLDVAYDSFRHRLVIASASVDARVVVIDMLRSGEIVYSQSLAQLTGQGNSQGGIQGVTVDVAGDYWLALAYFGIRDGGVLVKIDGQTLQPIKVVKQAGMNNPNGLITGFGRKLIYAMSDNSTVQEFDLSGSRLRSMQSVPYGYRGTVSNNTLWVCGWLQDGRMARINLLSGERAEFPCVPLANSVVVDRNGLVWVAGDAGVSVSAPTGELLALASFGAFANGLSILDNAAYFVTYDQFLNEARTMQPFAYIPSIRGSTITSNQ